MASTLDQSHDDAVTEEGPLVDVVKGFLANRGKVGGYDIDRYVNRAIQNHGAEAMSDRREMARLVGHWEAEASAPTGMHDDPEAMAEDLRSEMDGNYDRGRLEVADAVRYAQKSGKVLLDPVTCKMVVDLDHDGRMSQFMKVDVPEMFGVNPNYDPAAEGRLREMPANSGVDFSRAPRPQAPGATPRVRTPAPTRQQTTQRSSSSKEPTPLRQALIEELAKMRERQGFQPGDDPHQLG